MKHFFYSRTSSPVTRKLTVIATLFAFGFMPALLKAEGTKELCSGYNAPYSGTIAAADSTLRLTYWPIYSASSVGGDTRFATYFARPYQRLYIHAYPGEVINMGFRTTGNAAAPVARTMYYRLRRPDGTIVIPGTIMPTSAAQLGYIPNYTKAYNGPLGVLNNGVMMNASTGGAAGASGTNGGYNPKTYVVPAGQGGDYWIEFNMQNPNSNNVVQPPNSNSVNPPIATDSTATNVSDQLIKFLDITVSSGTTTVPNNQKYTGRVWTEAFALLSGNNQNGTTTPASTGAAGSTSPAGQQAFTSSIYIYTTDQVVNQLVFNQLFNPGSANYFNITSNGHGCYNTGNVAFDRKSYTKQVSSVNGIPTATLDYVNTTAAYKEFLNRPDSSATGFPSAAQPNITAASTLQGCGPGGTASYVFTIAVSNAGQAQVYMDLDGTPGYQPGGADLLIFNYLNAGNNTFGWNGKDNTGTHVTSGKKIGLVVNYVGGITHFPVYDMEENPNGLNILLVKPYSVTPGIIKLYFDDTNLGGGTTGQKVIQPTNVLGGYPASGSLGSPIHPWSLPTTYMSQDSANGGGYNATAGDGNLRTLNTWAEITWATENYNFIISDNCPVYTPQVPKCVAAYNTGDYLVTVSDADMGTTGSSNCIQPPSPNNGHYPPVTGLPAFLAVDGLGNIYVTNAALMQSTVTVTTTYAISVPVQDGVGSVANANVTLTFYPGLTPGTIAPTGPITFCGSGNPGNLISTGAPTGGNGAYTFQWKKSTDGGVTFAPVVGATTTTYAPGPLVTGTANTTYVFQRVVSSGGCTAATNPSATVIVYAIPTAAAGSNRAILNSQSTVLGGAPTASGGTSPYNYSWSGTAGAGVITGAVTSSTPTAAPTGGVGTYVYTVTVTDNNACTNSSNLTVTVNASASIVLTKTAYPGVSGSYENAQNFTYVINVTNSGGPNTATNVAITDLLPAGLAFVSAASSAGAYASGTGLWNVGTLTVNAFATLTLTVTPTLASASGGVAITNTASVTLTQGNLNPITTASVTVTINPSADLQITKTASTGTYYNGQPYTYTISLTNNGPDNATGVSISDAIPAGLAFVSANPTGTYNAGTGVYSYNVGNLAKGAAPIVVILTVTPTITGTVVNTVTATATQYDPTPPTFTTPPLTVLPSADLVVTKTVSPGPTGSYYNGQSVTYTISVANNGPDNATLVNVADVLPSGLTFVSSSASLGTYTSGAAGNWNIGNLGNAAVATLTIVVTPNVSGTAIVNTATISGNQHDPVVVNSTSSCTFTAIPTANLTVNKVVNPQAHYYNGTNVVYTITVNNAGPDDATGVVVSDPLPAGLSYVGSATASGAYNAGTGKWTVGGVTASTTVTLTLTAKLIATGTITNTATVTGNEKNITGTTTSSVTINCEASANLNITKTGSTTSIHNGQNVTYTIVVGNAGPDNATGVNVTDVLPAGLTFVSAAASVSTFNSGTGVWNIGNLAFPGTATLTIVTKANTAGTYTNMASVAGNEHDANLGDNNSSAQPVAVSTSADLGVVKTVNGGPVYILNQSITYTIVASNAGPDNASGVNVADVLPAGLTFVSAASSTGSYTSGAAGNWSIPTLNAGTTATLTINATTSSTGTITNTATISGPDYDPPAGNSNTSAVTIVVNKATDLGVHKTVSASPYFNGQNVMYTIVVNNAGPDNGTGVKVTDILPSGLTFVSAATAAGSYNSSSGVWTIGNLSNSGTATLTIVATPNTSGTIINTATITGNETETNNTDNSSSVPIVVGATANLSITKTASAASVHNGENITYTITVHNAGPDNATGVNVSDALPASLTFISSSATQGNYTTGNWLVGGLSVNSTATLTIVTTANTATTVVNTAIASANEHDANNLDNTATATTTVSKTADINVSKALTTAGQINIGQNVTFTITANNLGPDGASNLQITDLMPAGLTYVSYSTTFGGYNNGTGIWNIGNLASSATATLTITATINTPTLVTNTASVSAVNEYDNNMNNNTGSASVSAGTSADLKVVKTIPTGTFANGQNITFTIIASNLTNSTASGVAVTDVLNAGSFTFVSATVTNGTYTSGSGMWNIGSLGNSKSDTLILVAKAITTGTLTNTATISGGDYDPDHTNNSSTVTVPVGPAADLSVTKTVSTGPYRNGQNVTYTITISSSGPNIATGVKVNDLLPAGLSFVSASPGVGSYNSGTGVWNIGNMNNGEVEILTIAANITNSGTLTNTATAVLNEYDPNTVNNTSSSTINATPSANLSVLKTVNTGPYVNGQNVTYTIVASNAGPDNGTGVIVNDLLPNGSLQFVSYSTTTNSYNSATGDWNIGSLPVGTTASLQITAKITGNGVIANTANINGTNYDIDPTNNTSVSTINVGTSADLSIVKTAAPGTYRNGDIIAYTITINNAGPDNASGVNVQDVLPTALVFVSASASSGSYNAGNGTWSVGVLPTGVPASITINARFVSSGTVTNTASVAGADYDPNSGNNSSSATVNVLSAADLAVLKTVSGGPYNIGNTVNYVIQVTSNGPDNATNVNVTDALPAGLTFVSSSATVGTYNSATGLWNIGNLTAGTSQTLTIAASITATGTIPNTAKVTANEFDRDLTNNSSTVNINVGTSADLAITKTAPTGSYYNGDIVTYTITATNNGPNAATGVVAVDALSSSLIFVSATPSVGTYNSTSGQWNINNLANGAAQTLVIKAKINNVGTINNVASISGNDYDPVSANNTSAQVTISSGLAADLSVTKTVTAGTYYNGDNVTYTINVANAGPNTATGVQVNDVLPAGLIFVSASPNAGSYSSSTGVWSIGSLNNGGGATLVIIAKTNATGSITNTANVTATEHDPSLTGNTSSVTINVLPSADLSVIKTVSNGPYSVTGTINYTIKVSNTGPNDANSVQVQDVLPAGLTFISSAQTAGAYNTTTGIWNVPSLVNGTSSTLTISAQINQNGVITNTANIKSSGVHDPDTTGNRSTVSIGVGTTADLSVTKTVSSGPYHNGQSVLYTITAANAGPNNASGVTITDLLPAQVQFVSATTATGSYTNTNGHWNIGALANGANAVLTINAKILNATTITNTATIAGNDFDNNTANNSATATFTAQPTANLAVTKVVGPGPYMIGNTIIYTINIANAGPDNATAVNVTDLLPNTLQFVSASPSTGTYNSTTGIWAVGSFNNGSSTSISITAKILSNGTIANTANIAGAEFDNDINDNSSTSTINVGTSADLKMKKLISAAPYNNGQNVTYTLVVTNNGVSDAAGVQVTDVLPAGLQFTSAHATQGSYTTTTGLWAIGTVLNGKTDSLYINAVFIKQGKLVNVANVKGNDYDPAPSNNTDSVVIYVNATANLSVHKTVISTGKSYKTGGRVTYRLNIGNKGPDAATGVNVKDQLPTTLDSISYTSTRGSYDTLSGVWTVGNLPVGGAEQLTITARIIGTGNIVNNASIKGDNYDNDPSDNNDSKTINVGTSADLSITKTTPQSSYKAGDIVVYTLIATNKGPSLSSGIAVTDLLPQGLLYVGAFSPQGGYNKNSGVWTIGNLNNNASTFLQITTQATQSGKIVNKANITSNDFDPNSSNDTAVSTIQVIPQVDVYVKKTTPNIPYYNGHQVVYTITAGNKGTDNATGVIATDILPAGLQFVSASVTTGVYNSATGQWNIGVLKKGNAHETLMLTAKITNKTAITNKASITANEVDVDVTNNADSTQINAMPNADVGVTKSISAGTYLTGSTVTYTLTAQCTGPDAATNIVITENLDSKLSFVSAVATNGNYNSATGLWKIASIANGQTETLQITATINGVGTIANTIFANHHEHDDSTSNDTARVTINNSVPKIDLAVTNVAGTAGPYKLGQIISFKVNVKNNGPDAATGASVAYVLPSQLSYVSSSLSSGTYNPGLGRWTIGNMPIGNTALMVITAKIMKTGMIKDTAIVFANETDINLNNDTAMCSINVDRAIDLHVTKTAAGKYSKGDIVPFTITVKNSGPDTATNVVVNEQLPSGLTYSSSNVTKGSYNVNIGKWTVPFILAGDSAVMVIKAKLDTEKPVTNTASAKAKQGDLNPQDSTSSVTITPGMVDLRVIKTAAPGKYKKGDLVPFTIIVKNGGPDSATYVVVNEQLPGGLIYSSSNVTKGSYDVNTGKWTVPFIIAGDSAVMVINAKLDTEKPVTNTASAKAKQGDLNPQDSTSSVTITPDIINQPPTAVDKCVETTQNVEVKLNILDQDSDPEGQLDSGSVKFVRLPRYGIIKSSVTFDHTYTYTSTSADFIGVDTLYYTVSDKQGAVSNKAYICIVVKEGNMVPNGFSPNGDGNNDKWVIRFLDNYPDNDVLIYNRWGDEVLRTSGYNQDKAWDGGNLPGGTYYYIVKYRKDGKESVLTGYLTLLH